MDRSYTKVINKRIKSVTLEKSSNKSFNFFIEGGLENGMFLTISLHETIKPTIIDGHISALKNSVIVSINSVNVIGFYQIEAAQIMTNSNRIIIQILHVPWKKLREFFKLFEVENEKKADVLHDEEELCLLQQARLNVMNRISPLTSKKTLSSIEIRNNFISVPKILLDELNLQDALIDMLKNDKNEYIGLPIPYFNQKFLSINIPKTCTQNDLKLFYWLSLFEKNNRMVTTKLKINLTKENTEFGLGFTVFSAFNGRLLLAYRIFENGAAFIDGRLKSYDRIIKVDQYNVIDVASNQTYTDGLNHTEVIDWLRLLPIGHVVELSVERFDNFAPLTQSFNNLQSSVSTEHKDQRNFYKTLDKLSEKIDDDPNNLDSTIYDSLNDNKNFLVIKLLPHAKINENFGMKFKQIILGKNKVFVLKAINNTYISNLKLNPQIGDQLHSINDILITDQTSKDSLKKIFKNIYKKKYVATYIRFIPKSTFLNCTIRSCETNNSFSCDSKSGDFTDQTQVNFSAISINDKYKKVVLVKTSNLGYGLILKSVDGKCIIDGMLNGSHALVNNLLHIGDEIIQINNLPLKRMSYQAIIDLFRQIEPSIHLSVDCKHQTSFNDRASVSSV